MNVQVWSNPNDPRLGDYVRTRRFGYEGRVTGVHHGCPESEDWFAGQMPPLPASDYTDVHWVSVLVNGGGGVVVPVTDAEVVEPFPFTHRDVDLYFREDEFTTWPALAKAKVYGQEEE